MSNLLLAPKTRATTAYGQGHGGRRCTCCDFPGSEAKRVRRSVRRIEKAAWRKEVLGA